MRLCLPRALIARPGLFLADEPTGNLDSQTANDIMALLRRLQRSRNTTLIIATRDPAISAEADYIVHILDGKITGT